MPLMLFFCETATDWQQYKIVLEIGTPIRCSATFSPVYDRGPSEIENATCTSSLGCTGSATVWQHTVYLVIGLFGGCFGDPPLPLVQPPPAPCAVTNTSETLNFGASSGGHGWSLAGYLTSSPGVACRGGGGQGVEEGTQSSMAWGYARGRGIA